MDTNDRKIIDGLNEKLDGLEAQKEKLGEIAKDLEVKGENIEGISNQVKDLNEKHEKSAIEMLEIVKKNQEQLDALEAKTKGGFNGQGSEDSLKSGLNLHADTFKSWDMNSKVGITMKAGDMTQANSYTNDVASHTTLNGVYVNASKDRDVHVRDFMTVLPYDGDSLRYQQETAFDDGAAAKTEGSAAAQSDFDLTEQTATTKTLATYFTVSKEMLKFTPFLEGYIRTRGISKLLTLEDTQILTGSGAGANLAGLDSIASAYSDSLADTTITEYDVLFSAATQAMVAHYSPNVALVHPNDYRTMVLSKETAGVYVNAAAALNGAPVVANGALVVQTTAVTSGQFFVGDFRNGATLGLNENINISFSNENSTNFIDGNVTVLVEEKVALPVHNAGAFIWGTFAAALAEGTA